jgi:hypothetical protein
MSPETGAGLARMVNGAEGIIDTAKSFLSDRIEDVIDDAEAYK